MHFWHFMGFDYQELTKTSYFGNSALDEACMVVKSWGSNRQFNLLQNEYHIVLITYFWFENWTNSDLSMNICDVSLNFQWTTSMNIQWIPIVKLTGRCTYSSMNNYLHSLKVHCIHHKVFENVKSECSQIQYGTHFVAN